MKQTIKSLKKEISELEYDKMILEHNLRVENLELRELKKKYNKNTNDLFKLLDYQRNLYFGGFLFLTFLYMIFGVVLA